MVGIGYIQELEQKQILSQKMIQSANILQMDVQELEVYIQQQALENPLIDLDTVEDHISASQRNAALTTDVGRNQVKEKIESLGGKVTGSVTNKTDYLINNDITSNSSKNKKAKELNIPIITEDEFIEMIGGM